MTATASDLASVKELLTQRIDGVKELVQQQEQYAAEAVRVALASQQKLADKHNDLIRAAEKKDNTYATKEDVNRLENWQAKITGAMLLLAFLGVANLTKLWLS